MRKQTISCLLMSAVLLAGCAPSSTGEATASPETTAAAGSVAAETSAAADHTEASGIADASILLDYAQGIADGVYGWTLSEDGSYYMLSAIQEDGTPVESTTKQTMMGGGHGRGMQGGNGAGGMAGAKQNGAGGNAGNNDPLAMEQNMQAAQQRVNAQGVYIENNITNAEYQTMLVYVPAEYMTVNPDGSASFTDAEIGGYNAQTAPIIFQNNNGGWRSGSPKAPEYSDCLAAGMIYVSAGSRSRDAADTSETPTGKAPTPLVDLKAGVIALRANSDVIPGNKEHIISVGASGGGQMSSALGATGNMEEYYPYLYEAGAIGITYDEATDTYTSSYDDSVYAAMAYCPIADIENADLAYAWLRYDSTLAEDGTLSETAGQYNFSDFQLALQEDAAYAFGEYINSLELADENGNALTFDVNEDGSLNLRSGSYYDATLDNISDALNATLAVEAEPEAYLKETYGDSTADWLTANTDGTYQVTDLAAFINGTGLVRNKDIPGFDALDLSAENDAFGTTDMTAVHFSASIATLLQENYDAYAALDGFDAKQIDLYLQNALTGAEAQGIADQTYLLNAAQIMLDVAAGTQDADIARFWRTRNGTADQHTSFSVAYNICLAAQMAGADADYSLVWAMGHGSNEGTTTGTFVSWINEICGK